MKTHILPTLMVIVLGGCHESKPLSDAYGNFEAVITTISAQANGRIEDFNLEEGDFLKKNQRLGFIDTTQLVLQKKEIEARLGTLPKKLKNSLAEIAVLKEQKALIKTDRDRIQRLVDSQAAPRKQLDDMNGQLEVIDKKIAAIESSTSLTNQAILSEKGPLIARKEQIIDQIERSVIINPVPGTVMTKLAEPFEWIRIGAPLYRLGKLDTMVFRFYTSSHQLQNIKVGDQVDILVDHGKNENTTYPGTISWIAEEAEFTPKTIQTKEDRVNLVYAVKALVANTEGYLKIGLPGEVNFIRSDNGNSD